MDDLTTLGDEDFEALKTAVAVEQNRRDTRTRSRDQIRELVGSYVDAGGSIDDLVLAPPDPEPADDSELLPPVEAPRDAPAGDASPE